MDLDSIASIVAAIDLATRLFEHLSNSPEEYTKGYANRDYATLGKALNTVHFGGDGALQVLKKLAAEEPVTQAEKDGLFNFNQRAPDVEAALRRLSDAFSDKENLSIGEREVLRDIAETKSMLRWSVEQTANHAVHMGAKYDPKEMQSLVERIEAFNAAVEGAEVALRHWRKT